MELDLKQLEEFQKEAWQLFQGKHNDHASVSFSLSGGKLYLFFILGAEGGTLGIYASFPEKKELIEPLVNQIGSQIDREVLMTPGIKVQRFYNDTFNNAARKRRSVTIMVLEDELDGKVIPVEVMPHLSLSETSELLKEEITNE